MSRTRKRRIKLISQLLSKHEKRMSDAIKRALLLLAHEVKARWQPQDRTLLDESLSGFESKLSSIIFRYGSHVAGQSGTDALTYFSTKASMEIMMEAIRRWLSTYSEQRARTITEYMKAQIAEQFSKGLSPDQVRDNVLKIINTKGSALRIAKTETHTALERGAWEAAKSLGVRLTKEWVAVEDVRTRPDHALADGQVREINEPFSIGGELMQFPGDPTASAKQVVNCRCTALYHLINYGKA